MKEKTQPSVVFIAGIMPRSGTHFLANLLCKHADCEKSLISEDCFLKEAHNLTLYGALLTEVWKLNKEFEGSPYFEERSQYEGMLLENIGEGLIRFLLEVKEKLNNKRNKPSLDQGKKNLLITKTPQVGNISSFFKFFPHEKLILIVRDGRTLVESIVKSFNYDTDKAIRMWTLGARRIRRFEETHGREKYLLVKYEDLHINTMSEIYKILSFLDLDIEKYDFKAALDLPVVGSSTFKRGNGAVHWLPVKKTEEFNPLERSANWTRAQHERFNWLAKNELIYFGYEPKQFAGYNFFWKLFNHLMDVRTGIKNRIQKVKIRHKNKKDLNII